MLQVLNITAPIYLLIAAGFLAVRLGIFRRDEMRFLGRLLVLFVLPALVFRAITRYSLDEVLNLRYLAVYGLGSLAVLLLGALIGKSRGLNRPASAFYGMGLSASNTVFVGYPIVSQIVGPAADIALALCLVIENLLIIPTTLVLADASEQLPWHKALMRSFKALLRNPIFLSILAGFAFMLLDLQAPAALDRTLAIASGAAAPIALFMIGGVLVGQKLDGAKQDMATIALGKLLLHPVAVFLAVLVLPPLEPPMMTAALLFAAMPLPAVYPALAQRYGLDGFCSTALVAATVLSFLTLNTWLWLLPDVAQWLTSLTH